MTGEQKFHKLIEGIVRHEFADDAVIDSVEIQDDIDVDGLPVLKVLVIFSSKQLDAKKALGLARHLWPAIDDEIEGAYPIVSFRSKADNDKLSEAA